MTHGHELRRGNAGGKRGARWRGAKRGNWDNRKSIINKIYFLRNYIARPSPGKNFSFALISRINWDEEGESGKKTVTQLKRFISSTAGTLSAYTFRLAALLLGGEEEEWRRWRSGWKQGPN